MAVPLHSAYTSFFLILSTFPSLLLLLGLLRYTDLSSRDLLDFLEGWLPESLLPTATALVQSSYRHSSTTVISLSVLAALFLPLVSHTPFASVYGAAIGLFWLIPVHFISRFYFKKER